MLVLVCVTVVVLLPAREQRPAPVATTISGLDDNTKENKSPRHKRWRPVRTFRDIRRTGRKKRELTRRLVSANLATMEAEHQANMERRRKKAEEGSKRMQKIKEEHEKAIYLMRAQQYLQKRSAMEAQRKQAIRKSILEAQWREEERKVEEAERRMEDAASKKASRERQRRKIERRKKALADAIMLEKSISKVAEEKGKFLSWCLVLERLFAICSARRLSSVKTLLPPSPHPIIPREIN